MLKLSRKENFLNEIHSVPLSQYVLLLKVEDRFSASKPAMQVWFSVGITKSTREAIVLLVMTIFFSRIQNTNLSTIMARNTAIWYEKFRIRWPCTKHVEISKYKKTAPITKTIKRKNASMEFSLLFFYFKPTKRSSFIFVGRTEQLSSSWSVIRVFYCRFPLNFSTVVNQAEVTPCSYLQVTILFKRLSNEIISKVFNFEFEIF